MQLEQHERSVQRMKSRWPRRARTSASATCAVLAASACGAAAPDPTLRTDSAGIAIVEHNLTDLKQVCEVSVRPELVIGSVDGGAEYELYRVFGASELSDGRIAVVNSGSNEVRFYNQTGTHLQSVGRRGRGPGEFENAYLLWVLPGDTAWVGDYSPWQFHLFGPDGRWSRTVRPEPTFHHLPAVIEVLADGRTLLAVRPLPSENENWSEQQLIVTLHAPDGTVQDTVGLFPNGRRRYPAMRSLLGVSVGELVGTVGATLPVS
jgi:hypothetical protein